MHQAITLFSHLFMIFFFLLWKTSLVTLFFSLNENTFREKISHKWDLCVMFGLPNKCTLPIAVNMLYFSTCSQVGQRWLHRELLESSINCLINLICLQNLWFMVVLLGKLKEYDSVFDWLIDIAGYCRGGINCTCRKYGCVNTGGFVLGNILGWPRKLPILFKFHFWSYIF